MRRGRHARVFTEAHIPDTDTHLDCITRGGDSTAALRSDRTPQTTDGTTADSITTNTTSTADTGREYCQY